MVGIYVRFPMELINIVKLPADGGRYPFISLPPGPCNYDMNVGMLSCEKIKKAYLLIEVQSESYKHVKYLRKNGHHKLKMRSRNDKEL